jgi:hypothetical protein
VHDPLAALVFCQAQNFNLSVINGTVRVRDGRIVNFDLPAVVARHNELARAMVRDELT